MVDVAMVDVQMADVQKVEELPQSVRQSGMFRPRRGTAQYCAVLLSIAAVVPF